MNYDETLQYTISLYKNYKGIMLITDDKWDGTHIIFYVDNKIFQSQPEYLFFEPSINNYPIIILDAYEERNKYSITLNQLLNSLSPYEINQNHGFQSLKYIHDNLTSIISNYEAKI